jgi:hypothetical protein
MEHTRFIGLDVQKERISIALAESGRPGDVWSDSDWQIESCAKSLQTVRNLRGFGREAARGASGGGI